MLVNMDCKNCKCRKKLVDKLFEERNYIVEKVKIVGKSEDKCTLFYFQYSLQLTLELVLILFITNT